MQAVLDTPPAADHWQLHAHSWQHFGSPLRPGPADVAWLELALQGTVPRTGRSLLLGVTPELSSMAWPAGNHLLAVDQCPDMIRQLWREAPNAEARCGDWLNLPVADGALDAVVGDGVLVFFDFAAGVRRLMDEVHRVLHADGHWLLRVFTRPAQAETADSVHGALEAGEIGSFHAYKWRLAHALQPSLESGVRPAEVWRTWRTQVSDATALAARSGWPLAEISTIDAYQHSEATYYFPTLDELCATLSERFEVLDVHCADYELAERCPRLALRPRPA